MRDRAAERPSGRRVRIGYVVTGTGYAPQGSVQGPSGSGPSESLRAMAAAAALCSDASLVSPTGEKREWQAIGDPLEAEHFADEPGVLGLERNQAPQIRFLSPPSIAVLELR